MDPVQAINNSIETNDRISRTKTMYDVSAAEVFAKNFLAGFGRAVGNITIYIIFLVVIFSLFTKYALPQIQPLIAEYRQAMNSITKINNITTDPGTSLDTNQYQQFLLDLKSSMPIGK